MASVMHRPHVGLLGPPIHLSPLDTHAVRSPAARSAHVSLGVVANHAAFGVKPRAAQFRRSREGRALAFDPDLFGDGDSVEERREPGYGELGQLNVPRAIRRDTQRPPAASRSA